MKIPVAKPYLTEDEAKASYEAVLSGWVTQGPRVKEFEEKFAAYVGSKFAVAVSNCTVALHLALIVAEIRPDDEVICPSLTFVATANAITYVGAKPVFADVDAQTGNMDCEQVEALITPKTRAILLVHQLGRPLDLDAYQRLAEKHGIKLIEDAACAVGSAYKGRKIGQHTELVCFSFHPRKVMTTGDGGMITTSNEEHYRKLLLLRQHGMSVNDRERHFANKVIIENYVLKGFNYRMTDIQAAVGIKQLEKLDWIVSERREIACKYFRALKDIPCLRLPVEDDHFFWNYQTYCVYIKESSPIRPLELMERLLERGISTRKGVMAIHKEVAYQEYGHLKLPVTEDLSQNGLILPLYVPMSEVEIDYVISNLKDLLT